MIRLQDAEGTGRETLQVDKQFKDFCLLQGRKFRQGMVVVKNDRNGMADGLIKSSGFSQV